MGDGDEGACLSTGPAEGFFVCERCFEDDTLKALVRQNVSETECNFCGRRSRRRPVAAPLDRIIEVINEAIDREYDLAANNLGYESAEGGYYGKHWDTYDLLTDQIELELPNDDGTLFEIIRSCVGDEVWCERNPYSLRQDEKLIYSWEHFCEFIKYERRYFFLSAAKDDNEIFDPSELLPIIGSTVEDCGLIRTIAKGSLIYRARQFAVGEILKTSYDLAPPPKENATRSNRMSPAGIVMFYASDDPQTAAAEIDDKPSLGISIGTFRITRDILVLDLTRLPRRPAFFENHYGYDRYAVSFLHEFVRSMAARVEPGNREHVDYVPTQVVTEWFRTAFKHADTSIDGIYYPSAQMKAGTSLVLFAERDRLVLNKRELREETNEKEPYEVWGFSERQENAWLRLVRVRVMRQPTGS